MISIPIWIIPTIITIITFGYAIFIHKDSGGYGQGIGNVILMAPAGIISTIAWITYAIFK